MPSFRRVMQGFALATVITMTTASPVPQDVSIDSADCEGSGPGKPSGRPTRPGVPGASATSIVVRPVSTASTSDPAGPTTTGAAPALPTTGVNPELPSPDLGQLLYVTVGRGIQNYTCAGAGANSTSFGALATLYDATELAFTDLDAVHAIVLDIINKPQDTVPVNNNVQLQKLGNHFFDVNMVPTFRLDNEGKILYGAKAGDVGAPANADKGPAGTGAVDWLQLVPKVPYTSTTVGLGEVYRVETAGGNASKCTEAGTISVQYAAEYWFYA